jgi:hypothetical protein
LRPVVPDLWDADPDVCHHTEDAAQLTDEGLRALASMPCPPIPPQDDEPF